MEYEWNFDISGESLIFYLILYVISRTKWHTLTFMCNCLKTLPLCHSEPILLVFMETHWKKESGSSINGPSGLCSCARKSLLWQGDKRHESLFMKLTRPPVPVFTPQFAARKASLLSQNVVVFISYCIIIFGLCLTHRLFLSALKLPVFLAELLKTNRCFSHERSELWKKKKSFWNDVGLVRLQKVLSSNTLEFHNEWKPCCIHKKG